MENQPTRKTVTGVVVSDKMDKTRVVKVIRTVRHSKYEKVLRIPKKFHAHDEKNETHEGDIVEIIETRPLSKLKRWRIAKILNTKSEGSLK
ncbi:MAG: 30S ribosomal protein S17 [Elusimicrobia bacterium]|nr:30S ribosomal protein S17 [Elusimicrobiota bacterium]MBU2614363.1 30S ribosomal protein S17 [Elusimicrobiota bacterium]